MSSADGNPPNMPTPRLSVSGRIIKLLATWMILSESVVLAIMIGSGKPVVRAVGLMAGGLFVLWNVLGGALMCRYRNSIRDLVLRLPGPWQVKFVLFCTLLALLEEAVTTTMTNLAPVFGVPIGAAYITASTNYLDVVALHSVVVFIPMFIWWAWILTRWDFHPNAIFLLFGATGTLAEVSFGGPQALLAYGFWTFVYGLMIYLPAYCLPARPNLRKPPWWRYPLSVIFPILSVAPVAGPIGWLHPIKIHFPPLKT